MKIEERASLASLTTFGIGGSARAFVEVTNEEELKSAAREAGRGFFILGGGSNVLPPDEGLDALIIRIAIGGMQFEEDGDRTRAIVGAGVSWDDFVREAAARDLWGVENLAGVPGTVGGAAVQNIGAYGAELAQVFEWADVIDLPTGISKRLSAKDVSFGYRMSIFKKEPTLAIIRVGLSLSKHAKPNLAYGDLVRAKARGVSLSTAQEIGEEVRRIRGNKFPDLTKEGTAGSFFKNPVVSKEHAAELAQKFPELPQFPQAHEKVKVSLAWLLDHALSLKSFSIGDARLYEKQPLVIVAARGARTQDVEALAREVEHRVREEFGIELEREVIHMVAHFS